MLKSLVLPVSFQQELVSSHPKAIQSLSVSLWACCCKNLEIVIYAPIDQSAIHHRSIAAKDFLDIGTSPLHHQDLIPRWDVLRWISSYINQSYSVRGHPRENPSCCDLEIAFNSHSEWLKRGWQIMLHLNRQEDDQIQDIPFFARLQLILTQN